MSPRTIAVNLLDYNKCRKILNTQLLKVVNQRFDIVFISPEFDATPYCDRSNKLHTHPSFPPPYSSLYLMCYIEQYVAAVYAKQSITCCNMILLSILESLCRSVLYVNLCFIVCCS